MCRTRILFGIVLPLFILLLPLRSFAYGFYGGSLNCASYPGFVWSWVSNQCVQEICPVDSMGRDTREQCVCRAGARPVFTNGLLVSCAAAIRPPQATAEATATSTTAVSQFELAPASTKSGSSTAPLLQSSFGIRRRGIAWPVAVPTTVTLLFLLAGAIAYKLLKKEKK